METAVSWELQIPYLACCVTERTWCRWWIQLRITQLLNFGDCEVTIWMRGTILSSLHLLPSSHEFSVPPHTHQPYSCWFSSLSSLPIHSTYSLPPGHQYYSLYVDQSLLHAYWFCFSVLPSSWINGLKSYYAFPMQQLRRAGEKKKRVEKRVGTLGVVG